ncbi:protocadherin-20-like isoform X2 [Bombina bombina]|uniref:protocadherin-20-like isoform X2 n=1 Tax=Bombina bombina TaxID=8345 RepID=UPI00235AB17A|nr:protocadherin-20-like isoform X2 [Bombina bombina]
MEYFQVYLSVLLVVFHNLCQIRATKEVTFHISEEQKEGTFIGSLRKALQLKASVAFTMLDSSNYFLLDTESGNLYVATDKLDRDSLCPQDILDECVLSSDVFISSEEQSEIVKIKVYILDVNDNAPCFSEEIIILSVPEDATVGTMHPIDHLASDRDTKNNSALTYHLNCTDETFSLYQNAEVLLLTVQKPLDRETQNEYQMYLVASDGGNPALSGSTLIRVQVTDVNDNCPIFLTNNVSVNLPRNTSVNATVIQLLAVDEDIGENHIIQYVYGNRVQESSKSFFHLNSSTGMITLSVSIHDNMPQQHKLTVLAIGPGCAPAVAYISISIQELPKKDVCVELRFVASHENNTVSITEDAVPNTILAILDIEDPDHSILRPLYINNTSPFYLRPAENSPDRYLLLTYRNLDFELQRNYDIYIIGNSTVNGSTVYAKKISIKIEDVNDNYPQFSQTLVEIFIEENNDPGAFLLKLSASDADSGSNSKISYSFGEDPHSMFKIESTDGILTAGESFDREEEASYLLLITASDHGFPSKNSTCTVIVNILDQNDNAPNFPTKDLTFYVPENLPRGGEVGIINVTDADSGLNSEFSVYFINYTTLFSIDQKSLILRSMGFLDYERELTYELLIEATDFGNPPLSNRVKVTVFILDVNDNAPLILLPESNFSYVLVPPETTKGSCITKVHAIDYDAGMNGVITYSGIGKMGDSSKLFMIDALTGNITLKENTHGHHCGLYQLIVKASDHGYPEVLSTIVRVNILLNDSISNQSYLESLIMDKASMSKENQVISLSSCTKYSAMASFSLQLSVPTVISILAFSVFCLLGVLLFLCTRRNSKKKKKPDIEIPLKLAVDYYVKDWNELKYETRQETDKG